LMVLDLDQKSRIRLHHILGPQRFCLDDTPLRTEFHADGSIAIRDGKQEASV
jgi:hypothetical protein